MTQIAWQFGKCLSWDVTVTDTSAPSYVHLSAISADNASEKVSKYAQIMTNFDFSMLAFETLGPILSSGLAVLEQLGRKIAAISCDNSESSFLFQRLSSIAAVQLVNFLECLILSFNDF